jgi:uncharacterized protein YcfJ
MKKMIYLGATIGGVLGGYLGSILDKGNSLGAWSLVLGAVGGLAGIWAGYKIGQNAD